MNFHRHECHMRQSFNLTARCRQLAFCPYCGVINENSNTALSHMRKYLDLKFICGGCYSKSFLNGLALHKHMRTQCPSVTAIRDHSKCSRREDSLRVPYQPHKAPGSGALGLLLDPLVSPFLITQGSLEWSLGISVCQDVDLISLVKLKCPTI